MRPKIEKAMNKRSISVESSKPKKKIPKNYEVDSERYNAGSSSRNLDQEEIIFSQIKLCSNIDEKLQLYLTFLSNISIYSLLKVPEYLTCVSGGSPSPLSLLYPLVKSFDLLSKRL